MSRLDNLLPFNPSSRYEVQEFIVGEYGELIGTYIDLLDDDEGLEELVFRLACGELDTP